MALRGEVGWKATYKKQFGDRFLQLLPALKAKSQHMCLLNPFFDHSAKQAIMEEYGLEPTSIPYAYSAKEQEEEGTSVCMDVGEGGAGSSPAYFLDAASIIAALALDVQPGHTVLDMCAAPGGKALVLAAQLLAPSPSASSSATLGNKENIGPVKHSTKKAGNGLLVVNEMSPQRHQRLAHTMASFVPEDLVKASIRVTKCDASASATTMCSYGPYDRILLDAPCSSDRHLIQKGLHSVKGGIREWSTSTPKASAERQAKLLLHALHLLKPNGLLVYSTCALSPLENDLLIDKVIKKAAVQVEKLPLKDSLLRAVDGEVDMTTWGAMFLPDTTKYGPLYMCLLRKR